MALDGQAPSASLGGEALQEAEAQIVPEHHPEVSRLSSACHGHSPFLLSFPQPWNPSKILPSAQGHPGSDSRCASPITGVRLPKETPRPDSITKGCLWISTVNPSLPSESSGYLKQKSPPKGARDCLAMKHHCLVLNGLQVNSNCLRNQKK